MKHIDQLISRYPALSSCKKDIEGAAAALIQSFEKGGKLLVAGNGGSAADSDHITGELLKSFVKKRRPSADFIESLKTTSANPTSTSMAARIPLRNSSPEATLPP